jgi:hypothetical protein
VTPREAMWTWTGGRFRLCRYEYPEPQAIRQLATALRERSHIAAKEPAKTTALTSADRAPSAVAAMCIDRKDMQDGQIARGSERSMARPQRPAFYAIPWAWLGSCCVLALVGVACRQIVGFDERHPPDAAADMEACALRYGAAACAVCAQASCCHELSACAANPACAPYETCVGACNGDATCRAQCGNDHPPGTSSEGSSLAACLVAKCEGPCELTCGALAYGVQPDAAEACQSCVSISACDQNRACASAQDCDALVRCRVACGFRYDCMQECARQHPESASMAEAVGGAAVLLLGAVCSSECGSGGNWSCVGHVQPALTSPETISVAVGVGDYYTHQPFSGVDMSLCVATDPDCSATTAYDSRQTDAMGTALLQLTRHGSVDQLLSFYVQVTSSGLVPTRYYWGFPLTEASVSLTGDYALGFVTASPAEFDSFYESLSATRDSLKGTVRVFPRDCLGNPAGDVEVSLSGSVIKPIYNRSLTAIATEAPLGSAAFFNVPPGRVELTATSKALGKPISTTTVYVQSGGAVQVAMMPGNPNH